MIKLYIVCIIVLTQSCNRFQSEKYLNFSNQKDSSVKKQCIAIVIFKKSKQYPTLELCGIEKGLKVLCDCSRHWD